MRLLVSVRVPEEVGPALAGGADIIDAKEPAQGSLGAVAPEVLARIAERTPASVALSVALGDAGDPDQLSLAVAATALPERRAETFVKIGFGGCSSDAMIPILRAGLEAAVHRGLVLVPVAYADHASAGSPPPDQVLGAASAAGARALLIDTYLKDGRSLLDWIDFARPGPAPTSGPASGDAVRAGGKTRRPDARGRGQDRGRCRGPRRGLPRWPGRCGRRGSRPRSPRAYCSTRADGPTPLMSACSHGPRGLHRSLCIH